MRYAQVRQDINNVIEYLRPLSQAVKINFNDAEKQVSWHNHLPGINNNAYYPFEYQFNIDNQQYSILLTDGSYFQFYYKFNNEDTLTAAKISYFPCPMDTTLTSEELIDGANEAAIKEDQFLFDYLYNWVEIFEATQKTPVNTSQVRFDYDSRATSHEPAHLQFAGINRLRLPSSFFPLPFAFVELISTMFESAPEHQQRHIGHAKNNSLRLERVEKLICINQLN